MKKYKIVALCGKAGAGKDTLLAALQAFYPNEHTIIHYTTRPPRECEKNGVDYYFVNLSQLNQMHQNNEIFESASFNNWTYATGIESLKENKINFGVFDPEGIKTLDKNPNVEMLVIVCNCPDNIRLIRQLSREKSPYIDEIIRRYYADEEDWKDFLLSNRPNTLMFKTDGSLPPDEEAFVLKQYINDWAESIN